MKTLIAGAGLALLLGPAASAQEQPDVQQAGEARAPAGFHEPSPSDLLFTRLLGIPVYAPEDAAAAGGLPDEAGTVGIGALDGLVNVGAIVDFVADAAGAPRAIVVWRRGLAAAEPGGEAPAETAPMLEEPADGAPPPEEVAVAIDQVRFLSDATVPDLVFAVIGVPADALAEAPLLDRGERAGIVTAMADRRAAPGETGWHPGRIRMTAPEITLEGFTPTPVTEISAEDLRGASVFGAEREHIGQVGAVVLGPDGAILYLTVDIGGFLGIGGREVAIGFDEVTVLRDAGRAELQVHVGATRAMLETMPEHDGEG